MSWLLCLVPGSAGGLWPASDGPAGNKVRGSERGGRLRFARFGFAWFGFARFGWALHTFASFGLTKKKKEKVILCIKWFSIDAN